MDRGDWYFIVGTALAIISLLGVDWNLVNGRLPMPRLNRRNILFLCLILGSVGFSTIGWHKSSSRDRQMASLATSNRDVIGSNNDLKEKNAALQTRVQNLLTRQRAEDLIADTMHEYAQSHVHDFDRQQEINLINARLHEENLPYRATLTKPVTKQIPANPCSSGHMEVDNFKSVGAAVGIETVGRVPCLTMKNPTVEGGSVGFKTEEKANPNVPIKPQ
jgi:hypothetical protein